MNLGTSVTARRHSYCLMLLSNDIDTLTVVWSLPSDTTPFLLIVSKAADT
jgi:hypothetical protein